MTQFELNKNNGTPLYIQVKNYLAMLMDKKLLEKGERLPTSRQFAQQLGVNRNTILAAYQELEIEGRIKSHIGRGTYVNFGVPASSFRNNGNKVTPGIYDHALDRSKKQKHSALLSKYYAFRNPNSDDINLAFPYQGSKNLPLRDLQNSAYLAIHQFGKHIFDLVPPDDTSEIVGFLPRFLIRKGIVASPKNIIFVNGNSGGLDFLSRIFLEPGDCIVTEDMITPDARNIFENYGAKPVGIPMDESGMRLDILEDAVRRLRPKFIYTTPTFHDPSTISAPVERRRELLKIASDNEVPIIENDHASDLNYTEKEAVSLKALDRDGVVVYLSSFSNAILDGLQLGWIVAPEIVISKLNSVENACENQSNHLIQAIFYEFCSRGYYDKLLKRTIRVCKKSRDLTQQYMRQWFPAEARFANANGGYYIWIDLPRGISGSEIAEEALTEKVVVIPKYFFTGSRSDDNGLRLCFITSDEPQIEKGIRILGEILKRKICH